MSFMILVRNPSTDALFHVTESQDSDRIKEYDSHAAAVLDAKKFMWHDAWPWDVVEIDV